MLVFGLFVAAVVLVVSVKCECGKPAIPPNIESAHFPSLIVNGVEAVPHSWPWQVEIQYSDSGMWEPACGGTIITPKHILTVAHIFWVDKNPQHWRVLIGAHNISEYSNDRSIFYVASIVRHEHFHDEWTIADIAILTLIETIRYSAYVSEVCLTDTDFHGEGKCFATGWGRTADFDPNSDSVVLRQMEAYIRPSWFCYYEYYREIYVNETMICAEDNRRKMSHTCSGDSGGPLVCQNSVGVWELQGIFSWGKCTKPMVYTRVPYYYKWIQDRILG